MGMPVFDNGRLYLTSGGDLWWCKREGVLQCIDPAGSGDITSTALRWSYPLTREVCVTPGCGQLVKRLVQSGRSTFYCESCQPRRLR